MPSPTRVTAPSSAGSSPASGPAPAPTSRRSTPTARSTSRGTPAPMASSGRSPSPRTAPPSSSAVSSRPWAGRLAPTSPPSTRSPVRCSTLDRRHRGLGSRRQLARRQGQPALRRRQVRRHRRHHAQAAGGPRHRHQRRHPELQARAVRLRPGGRGLARRHQGLRRRRVHHHRRPDPRCAGGRAPREHRRRHGVQPHRRRGQCGDRRDLTPTARRFFYSTENNTVFAYNPAVSNTPLWSRKMSGNTQAMAAGAERRALHRRPLLPGHHVTTEAHLRSPRSTTATGALTSWDVGATGGKMGVWALLVDGATPSFTAAGVPLLQRRPAAGLRPVLRHALTHLLRGRGPVPREGPVHGLLQRRPSGPSAASVLP